MHHLYCIIVAIVALLTEHVYHPTDHIKNAINLHNKHSNHKNEEHNLNKIPPMGSSPAHWLLGAFPTLPLNQ